MNLKRKNTTGLILLAGVTVFLWAALSCTAAASPNFMANAGTSGSDAFFKVAVTSDGGYAGFGKADGDAVVTKFDANGNEAWSRSFPGVATSNCNAGAAGDNAMFLTGRTASNTLWVVKLDNDGTILWQKTYTHGAYTNANMMGVATASTQDGGCVVSLRIRPEGASATGYVNYDQGLAKIAADGTLEWIKCYGSASYDFTGEVIESRNPTGAVDGYLIATHEDDWAGADDNGVILVKVDTTGNLIWSKFYEGYNTTPAADGNEFVKGLCQTADYGYAIVGNSYSASDPAWGSRRTPYIIKVDHGGNKIWAKRFGILSSNPGGNSFTYGDVAQAADNTDLIVAGTYYGDDFWLLRLSENGDLLKERVYPAGDSARDGLGSIAATADGGAVASRWSKSFGAGDDDAFLMKFDANLRFPGTDCDGGVDPSSEIAAMQFETADITDATHVLDYTAQWTVADDTTAAVDPGFLIWNCTLVAEPSADNFLANFGTSGSDRFNAVKATPDGGYAVVGQVGNFVTALKINPYGNLEWRHLFDGVRHSNLTDIDVDADGFIYISGYVNATDDHPKSLWVAKLAPWGAVQWEKIVAHNTASSRGLYIAASGDGGCAVSSPLSSAEDGREWSVFRLTADGTLAWAKRYGSPEFDMWCRIIAAKDPATGQADGYLLAEFSKPMGSSEEASDVVLIRIDNDGDMLWAANYAGYADATHTDPDNEFVDDIVQTYDGGFAVLGRSYDFSDPAWPKEKRVSFLLKVDPAGTLLWSRSFHHNDGSSNTGSYRSLTEAINGDLIVASTDVADQMWLLRFSTAGVLENETVYNNGGTDYVYGVHATPDNGAVAVGRSNAFGAGDYDAWIMKFGADLKILDGCTGTNPNSVVSDAEFVTGTPTPHAIDVSGFASFDYLAPVSDPGFIAGYVCAIDKDSDNDGVQDYKDNCPMTANPDQWDGDGDGIGNACDADLNNDGFVDHTDFMNFRSTWGSSDGTTDFNADSTVDLTDFMIFKGQWGTTYPWY